MSLQEGNPCDEQIDAHRFKTHVAVKPSHHKRYASVDNRPFSSILANVNLQNMDFEQLIDVFANLIDSASYTIAVFDKVKSQEVAQDFC